MFRKVSKKYRATTRWPKIISSLKGFNDNKALF